MSNSKVKKLVTFLDKNFPFKKAEAWDKVGHFAGDQDKALTKVVVALDLTKEVMDKAIESKAEAIVIHHPFIFADDKKVEFAQAPYKKQILSRIKSTEINVIALHTNFDISKDGMVKTIGKAFGKPYVGSSKYGFIVEKEMKFSEIKKVLEEKLKSPIQAKYLAKEYNEYSKIGILPGSGSPEDILSMVKDGVQLVITSDIKWSTWVMAKEQGINLVQVPHSIEQAFVDNISSLIKKNFNEVQVIEIYPTIF